MIEVQELIKQLSELPPTAMIYVSYHSEIDANRYDADIEAVFLTALGNVEIRTE